MYRFVTADPSHLIAINNYIKWSFRTPHLVAEMLDRCDKYKQSTIIKFNENYFA